MRVGDDANIAFGLAHEVQQLLGNGFRNAVAHLPKRQETFARGRLVASIVQRKLANRAARAVHFVRWADGG